MSQSNSRILIVDDNKTSLIILQNHLLRLGHEVVAASTAGEALFLLEEHDIDLVISDLVMPVMDGIQLMRAAKERNPLLPFVIFTAEGSIESAVSAIRQGALDYLEKPLHIQQFEVVLQRALQFGRLSAENAQLKAHFRQRFSFHNLVAESPAMIQTLELAAQVTSSAQTTVSLFGESGVGKEVLARAIHFESGGLPGSYVAVNCAAIPESLLESELFGHVRGAFTGAEQDREGKFSQAQGGTVLLDEIGDMPLALQAKLLRILEERTFEKVGTNKPIKADFRVIVATNQNLSELVKQGTFRQDLFHRINVFPITIPPLRQRKEDIPLLMELFLELFRKDHGKVQLTISKSAMDMLIAYSWPGNVRELRNILEYAAIVVADELIKPEHLRLPSIQPLSESIETSTIDFNISLPANEVSLHTITRQILDNVLQRCDGNKSKAASILKVNRKRFYR